MSDIYTMDEQTGTITKVATYSVNPYRALVNYIMQSIRKNNNWWTYPSRIDGIRESTTVKDHYYFDDITNNRIIASYPTKQAKHETNVLHTAHIALWM